jgi:hypothetical protein
MKEDSKMIKLTSILFESVDKKTIVHELANALESSSELTERIWNEVEYSRPIKNKRTPSHEDIAKFIYKQSANVWDNILKGAQTFKFIGSGTYGLAFDLGDKVLKLEEKYSDFSTRDRTKMANKALWSGYKTKPGKLKVQKDKEGSSVPMVYDHGEFTILGNIHIFWVVNEKFETSIEGKSGEITSVEKWGILLDKIIKVIHEEYTNLLSNVDISKADKKTIQIITWFAKDRIHSVEELKSMEEDLRLAPDWLDEFVADMIKLKKKAESGSFTTDFHAGNLGIRRKGAEGYLKFFD